MLKILFESKRYFDQPNLIVMKKLFTFLKAATLLLCLFGSKVGHTQCYMFPGVTFVPFDATAAPYSGYSAFTYLGGSATRVTSLETDDAYTTIPIGFNFKFGTIDNTCSPADQRGTYTSVIVSSNGWLQFTGATAGSPTGPTTGTSQPAVSALTSSSLGTANPQRGLPGVWPLWTNLSGSGGTASYRTDVLASGNRVFTMEFKNWRWDNAATTTANISFQVKLYEGSNIIEFWYKQESGALVASNPAQIGLGVDNSYVPVTFAKTGYNSLSDASAAPTLRGASWGANITSRPASNQVYQFYQACGGKPSAGYVGPPDSVCANLPFTVKALGATPSPIAGMGITYQWQAAPTATGPWGSITPPITNPSYYFPSGITTDTFLRFITYCSVSGLSDTTPVKHITLITLPYNCYCYSTAIADVINVNVGNVKVKTMSGTTLLNAGTGTTSLLNPGPYVPYTLNTGLRPIININADSTYQMSITGITTDTFAFSPTGVAAYIDYNHDGQYQSPGELAVFQVLSGTTTSFTSNFTVPGPAALGITGMRVVMQKDSTTPSKVLPCGAYNVGETEDYIVNISYPQCPGPISAGTAYISDTSICQNYQTTVWDTAHARYMTGMSWIWEYSLDNINWATVPGSLSQDTIQPVVLQTTYYRLRTICDYTHDTVHSNTVKIKLKDPYKCYCLSYANGGPNKQDTSDITTVILGSFVMNTGGPHVLNPSSYRMRTDHTDLPAIELTMGKTYPIAVYETMLNKYHADAKITVFIDYNHNLAYDAPTERVWTALATNTNYFPHDSITIPMTVIPNVETGLRFILNNNTGANIASDLGCGTYTSGETEDYLVIFRKPTTAIGEITNVDNLQIFPNPTNNGAFTVSFNAANHINEATLSVTNITGQQVYGEQFGNIGATFSKNISLAGQPTGVYFVTLVVDGQKSVSKLTIR